MIGHSVRAATTVEILRHADRFQWVGQGIMYDIWGIALNPPKYEPRHRINAPIIGINSEAFMYWSDKFSAATRVCDEAKMHGSLAWLLTVRGTVHISQSDFATPIAPFHRCLENEKLLELPCVSELPTEHKPDEEGMAVRLKVPQKARARVSPKLRRRLKKSGGLNDEKEVWMHMTPGTEDLKSRAVRGCASKKKEDSVDKVEKIG